MKNVSKTSIIRILQVLEKHSDADHPLQHQEIATILAEEYGVTLERKAIGYNVKLLAELLIEEDSPIKVVTKRKLGTYISGRYIEDEDIAFLIDLVLSNCSICSEHRKRLFDKLNKMASVSFRASQQMPATFDLVDPEDSEDFAEEKQLTNSDDVDMGIVAAFRKAIHDKQSLTLDCSVQGEGMYRFEHYLPIYLGVYNGRYYAYCYTAEQKYTWLRLDYVYHIYTEDCTIAAPSMGDFISAHVGQPEKDTITHEVTDVPFVLMVDSVIRPDRLVKNFGTGIEFKVDNKAHLYTAKFFSNWDKVRPFVGEYWESVVVAKPECWQEEEDNRQRLLTYYRKNLNGTDET